jgi:THO complex subunit 4
MSANKLDKSLDEILSSQRRTSGRRGGAARRSIGGRPATTAPVGGVQKNARPARNAATKPAPTKPASAIGTSKIVVSNMVRPLILYT